ncbi:MAG: GNAT family N-acetyltransferase [Candidatus Eremiobacteraeota bacterium]|nr:GNAT family N-acetyltransferase [Candidatus Eremiobacteraeota bacterium]
MADAPLIVSGTAEDVAYYAHRRYDDEESLRLYRTFASNSPNGAFVARDVETPIGIGFASALDDEWFLSELFVEPSFQKQAIASQLLDAVAEGAGDVTRSGLLDPAEAAALAFFLKRGVALQTPVLSFSGAIPKEEEVARMAAGQYRFTTAPIDHVAHGYLLAALDRESRGTARTADHAYFAENAAGVTFEINGEFVGYVYVWPSGRIGPMVTASQAYAVQMLAFALMLIYRTYGATWCRLLIPGTNLRVLRAALRAGLAIEKTLIFASDASMLDLSRYVGFHQLLF